MIFFTSDNHFGKYTSADEAIERWNRKVSENDTVYIAGDMFSHDMKEAEKYLDILNGKKILILGNNDPFWLMHLNEDSKKKYFSVIVPSMVLNIGHYKIELCHFPKKTSADILICGHIHASQRGKGYSILKNSPCSFNAGVMITDGQPVSFSELVGFNEKFYERGHSEKEEVLFREIDKELQKL